MTIDNLTPGFYLSVLLLMIKFHQNNKKKNVNLADLEYFDKFWSNILIN